MNLRNQYDGEKFEENMEKYKEDVSPYKKEPQNSYRSIKIINTFVFSQRHTQLGLINQIMTN